MSSFKRTTPSKQAALAPGTRPCAVSVSTVLTSSGIPSLDDILGGGIPLSCSVAVLAPDSQSAYGELVQKYFIAQGISSGHKVCVIHEDGLSFVKECMWMPAPKTSHPIPRADEEVVFQDEEKIKIAWRYEQMKKFETTVTNVSTDRFCDVLDLTCRVPVSVVDAAHDAKRLIPLNPTVGNDLASSTSTDGLMRQMEHILATTPSTEVVRLSVVALGSPEWGEHCPADVWRFMYALRRLLRRYPHGCACVSLAPHYGTDRWAGLGWVQKVGWASDAAISMLGFGANPGLTTLFPSHHGLVQIHKLPAPHCILPTSDRCSTLRGLSSTAATNVGAGENNLAFKCTRKRLVFETMHLGFEGGVGERRTTPSSAGVGLDAGLVHTHATDKVAGLARVTVELEETGAREGQGGSVEGRALWPDAGTRQKERKTKRVAFRTETAELYAF